MASGVAASLYLAFVLYFYYWSRGFVANSAEYPYLKTCPVAMLSLYCFLVGGKVGLRGKNRVLAMIALCAGAIGDFIIGYEHKYLAAGALAFGIGHICYLLTFVHRVNKISSFCSVAVSLCSVLNGLHTVFPRLISNPYASLIMIVYVGILSTCLTLSASLFFSGGVDEAPWKFNNFLRFSGFLLFYISDTLLGINFLSFAIPNALKLILFTYFTAQYLIFWSTCRINSGLAEKSATGKTD